MSYRDDMEQNASPEAFEARMLRALERAPEPQVPADFAARIAASLPALPPPRKPLRLGRTVALLSVAVLAVAMFLLAPLSAPTFSSIAFDLEILLLLQMAGIAYWLTVKQSGNR